MANSSCPCELVVDIEKPLLPWNEGSRSCKGPTRYGALQTCADCDHNAVPHHFSTGSNACMCTAYLPQSSDVVEPVSAFEAEAVHSGPAPLDVQNEATEQDPVFQVLHARQTLPPESWEAFGQAYTVVVGDVGAAIPTAVQEGTGPSTVAYRDLKTFPSYTLCD